MSLQCQCYVTHFSLRARSLQSWISQQADFCLSALALRRQPAFSVLRVPLCSMCLFGDISATVPSFSQTRLIIQFYACIVVQVLQKPLIWVTSLCLPNNLVNQKFISVFKKVFTYFYFIWKGESERARGERMRERESEERGGKRETETDRIVFMVYYPDVSNNNGPGCSHEPLT